MKLHSVLIVLLGLGVLAVGGLAADDGRIEIGPTDGYPIVIDEPGSYVLTTDLEVVEEDVNAIEIVGPVGSGRLTLDLGGHVIRGPCSGTGWGISSAAPFVGSIRVSNGIVTCFDVGVGVGAATTSGSNIIENVSAIENLAIGIYTSFALITDCSVSENGTTGIVAENSTIRDCVSTQNAGDGIVLEGGVVSGSTARWNDGDGIDLDGHANQVAFCGVAHNGGYGVNMPANANNNISHSAGSDNAAGNVINCGVGNGCHHNMLP